MHPYPKPDRLLLACRLVVAVWVLFGLFIIAVAGAVAVAAPCTVGRIPVAVPGAILAAAALAIVVELAIAWTLDCPACGGWVLLQTSGPFHPAARVRWGGLGGYYAPIVADVLRRRRFTCMYCGRDCSL